MTMTDLPDVDEPVQQAQQLLDIRQVETAVGSSRT